jgi:hypothetical protein
MIKLCWIEEMEQQVISQFRLNWDEPFWPSG